MILSFVDELSAFAQTLEERGHKLFSSTPQWTILANGDADFHDNVIFFGFDDRQTDPVVVVKVPRLNKNGWMLQTEYEHLLDLWNCAGVEAVNYVPMPYAMTTLQDRSVLLLSHLSGESLTRLSPRSFWGDRERVLALAREAARSLRRLNDLTESPIEHGESLPSGFPKKAEKFRELFPLTSQEDQVLSDLQQTVEKQVREAAHKILIQGDFWHGNMIRAGRSGRLKFVDWQFARWSADVSLDLYFFLLAGALSATIDLPGEERAKQAFHLLQDWRTGVIPDYLAAYGKPDHSVLLPPKQGMLLCCVEKAVRSALDFGYSHPDDLLWRALFAELLHWPDQD